MKSINLTLWIRLATLISPAKWNAHSRWSMVSFCWLMPLKDRYRVQSSCSRNRLISISVPLSSSTRLIEKMHVRIRYWTRCLNSSSRSGRMISSWIFLRFIVLQNKELLKTKWIKKVRILNRSLKQLSIVFPRPKEILQVHFRCLWQQSTTTTILVVLALVVCRAARFVSADRWKLFIEMD